MSNLFEIFNYFRQTFINFYLFPKKSVMKVFLIQFSLTFLLPFTSFTFSVSFPLLVLQFFFLSFSNLTWTSSNRSLHFDISLIYILFLFISFIVRRFFLLDQIFALTSEISAFFLSSLRLNFLLSAFILFGLILFFSSFCFRSDILEKTTKDLLMMFGWTPSFRPSLLPSFHRHYHFFTIAITAVAPSTDTSIFSFNFLAVINIE